MKYKIIQNNLISCLIAVTLTAIICIMTYGHFISESMLVQAENQAYVLKEVCQDSKNSDEAVEILNSLQDGFKSRITLISENGTVLFDSMYDEQSLENHLEREEVREAIESSKGSSQRVSYTDNKQNYYFALKVKNIGIIRVGVSSQTLITEGVFSNLPIIVLAIIAVLIIVYKVSEKTTKRIVSTIENYNFDDVDKCGYEELSPFIKKIEDQRETIENQMIKIEAEREKLSSVFSNMEECIIVCDKNKNITQANRRAKEIFGTKINSKLTNLADNDKISQEIESAFDNKIVHGLIEHNNFVYQYTISPNIQNGNNKGAILIFLDITQQVQSQKMRREFTANVTHELKTPLTSILGYSQLISSGIAKPEDIVKFGEIIEKNAKLLLTLIEDIMQISALEENGVKDFDIVDLKCILNDVIKDLMPAINDKNIVYKSDIDNISIQANYKQMGDICRNLISNAIKYNKENGEIFVSLKQIDNNAVLKVKDTGIGISQSDLQKVFQRFFVVDKSRNKNISSTGLGLSIVKHIADAMGGHAQVQSKLGEGSCFTITLPITQEN